MLTEQQIDALIYLARRKNPQAGQWYVINNVLIGRANCLICGKEIKDYTIDYNGVMSYFDYKNHGIEHLKELGLLVYS